MMIVLWYRRARLALVAVVAVRNGMFRELHPAGRRTTGPSYPRYGTPPLVPDPATPSLLHPQVTEEAWGWRAIIARHLGKG